MIKELAIMYFDVVMFLLSSYHVISDKKPQPLSKTLCYLDVTKVAFD